MRRKTYMCSHVFSILLGLFRERKRSKSKTKIDTRSIKLQELQAPSQMSVVSSDGRTAPTSRSRSPNSKYTESKGN